MRATSLVVCLLNLSLVLAPGPAGAGDAPDAALLGSPQAVMLAGRWVRIEPSDAAGAFEPHEPDVEETQQTGFELQVTRRWPGRSKTVRYVADGVERDDDTQPGARIRTGSENGRLVTTWRHTVTLPHGAAETVTVRQTRWLEAADRMRLETTWTAGATSLTRRVSYRLEVQ